MTASAASVRDRWAAAVGRHPKRWGLALAVLLAVGYVVALRPARLWVARHVAYPLLQQVDTNRSRGYVVTRIARRPDAVFAVPRDLLPPRVATDAEADAVVRARVPPQWAAPVGVIFLLPAMFLAALFPSRPYWLWLLVYHVVLGVVSFGVFAVGLAAWAPAFKLYTFARTYMAETVSLVVPLLLALAARAGDAQRNGAPQ